MDLEKTQKTVGAVAACIAGIIPVIKWVIGYLDSRRSLKDIGKLYSAMYNAMARAEASGAARVIIFSAHGKGQPISTKTRVFVSALHYNVPANKSARVSDYSELEVDSHYVDMLLASQHRSSLRVSLQDGCLLARIYASEGVVDAVVCFLGAKGDYFYYVKFASYDAKFTDSQILEFEMVSHQLAQHIKPII